MPTRERIASAKLWASPARISWRCQVPDGQKIAFEDLSFGHQELHRRQGFFRFPYMAPRHLAAYQLAVVTDDEAIQITEVVRRADLLTSTPRQLLFHPRSRLLRSPVFPLSFAARRTEFAFSQAPPGAQPVWAEIARERAGTYAEAICGANRVGARIKDVECCSLCTYAARLFFSCGQFHLRKS
jgi:hypothetical protein